ncbi:LysR family transcriptional regulator [Scytonema sp. NUACC26]|uniref:LysR family transcriptional regulator n=1 Tax=Scytonema sp. NUACC26 TaxID=3140176 RepID=UPI0034DBC788
MELRHLRYFVVIAEELHFGRAAERLHMTQQPLSQQIRQLEAEIGVLLFHRTKRRVQLTEAGKAFLEEARQILHKASQAVEIAKQVARGENGKLTVGFSGFATYSLLPKVLRIFREQFPLVELELEEMTSSAQVQALQHHQIHLGLMIPPIPGTEFVQESILREPLVVILPETHPLATQPELKLSALANESFILVSRHLEPGYYDLCISLFQQAGFSPKVVQKASQKQTILGLVSADMGVSLAPASIRNIHRTGVVYTTLSPLNVEVELMAVWRQDETSTVLQTFVRVIREIRFQK